ncbi:hypothetical protein SAMN05421771_0014 [Granulicella pectinivorans]|uniref:Uncharacterized protein n=1 Tax=Granulicella pectinivorans TaxID=474950 RepID=A0A1I6KZH1_9BACT|nr:hypothetical protein [Granulicella pectinivorans]SFR96622.1 hypothetical protein SAMN05421771_0014 [Granulicella pectinivorans]
MGDDLAMKIALRRCGLIAGLLTVLCCAYLLYPAIRARYLFSRLETLRLGSSTFEDAKRVAAEIGAKTTEPCNPLFCEWSKRIDNAQLPRWWRGTGEVFVVTFDVKNSVISRTSTGYGIESDGINGFSPSSIRFDEVDEHWWRDRPTKPVTAGWSTSDRFRYYQFVVYMTRKATADDRKRYTAFDYGCLWKYHGCKDARELLPTADPFPENEFRDGHL